MATIRLFGEGGEVDERLPKVCVCCGEPATTRKDKHFKWNPPWVPALILAGLLPYVLVHVLTQKRMRVRLPVCDDHRRPWLLQNLATAAAVVGLLVWAIGLPALMAGLAPRNARLSDILLLVYLVGFLVWFGVILGMHFWGRRLLRPEEITDRSITLTNVSEEFSDALLALAEEEKSLRRERRRQRYEEDEDDEPASRRRGSRGSTGIRREDDE